MTDDDANKPPGDERREGPATRPPATVPDPATRPPGPVPPRSEALPPELPGVVRAFVMAGPPGSVTDRTDARAAVPPDRDLGPVDELAQRRSRDETARLRARVDAIEQENRQLWAMLIEERRERAREFEHMSRLVELARRNPPGPESGPDSSGE